MKDAILGTYSARRSFRLGEVEETETFDHSSHDANGQTDYWPRIGAIHQPRSGILRSPQSHR